MDTKSAVHISVIREKNRIGVKVEGTDTVWGATSVEALQNFATTMSRLSEPKRREIFGAIEEEQTQAKRAG